MAIDLIKSYLVGIGFQVDENSFNQTQNSMNEADKTINKFNKNSQEGFSNTGDVLKDLFTLLKSSSGTLVKIFPGLQAPFSSFINDIGLIKKLYVDLNKEIEKTQKSPRTQAPTRNENINYNTTNNTGNNSNNRDSNLPSVIQNSNELTNSSKNLIEQILNAKNASEGLVEEGGNAFKLFSIKALGPITAVVAGIAVFTLAAKGLSKFLNELANQDIEYEKLSRQLWTTKENAKEVDMALKTMGVTIKDLWLSPTLLKQFNQLRKDSAALKLPKEYTDNLKIIQGIGLEFKRFSQLGKLAFQWIGNYILKYAAGPLNDLRQMVHSFNDWLIKNIPGVGKVIGGILGVLIRIIGIILKIGAVLFKLTSPFFKIIELIGKIQDKFESLPEPVKKNIKSIMAILVLLTNPLMLIISLIDDLMTYFKGGKSLTGTFIDKFNKSLDSSGRKIKGVIDYFRNLKKEILNSDFGKFITNIGDGIKKGIENIKNGDFKDLLGNVSVKVKDFSGSNMNNLASNYATSNISNTSKTTTQNSHNNIKNENKIYVYGGNDANSTGKAVKNNVNGITIRNLQGVF